VRVMPELAAVIERTATMTSDLCWKWSTSFFRSSAPTLPSIRMYLRDRDRSVTGSESYPQKVKLCQDTINGESGHVVTSSQTCQVKYSCYSYVWTSSRCKHRLVRICALTGSFDTTYQLITTNLVFQLQRSTYIVPVPNTNYMNNIFKPAID
jgi:hypothetical protein